MTAVEEKTAGTAEDTAAEESVSQSEAVEEELGDTEPTSEEEAKETVFSELQEDGSSQETPRNLDFLLDVPLEVTVELGRARMLIADLLRLGPGAIVELGKAAGEPLDIFVNDKLMGRGEVVVVNDKFAVRLADIISPAERVKKLA